MYNFLFIACAMVCTITASMAQNVFTLKKITLPGATEARDIYVQRSGNYYLMNGDIIVDQVNSSIAYQANTSGNYTWPKGYIPVEIEDTIFSMGFGDAVMAALDYYNKNTRLRFKPRSNEADYIFINFASAKELGFTGGSSWVGRHGGRQVFNLSSNAFDVILHELMHAAGFWHEQSRYDRDKYVEILWDNIEDDHKHNFQLESGVAQGNYDYGSIMHYFSTAFAKKGTASIKCKTSQGLTDCPMGSSLPSGQDITAINNAYWYNQEIPNLAFSTEYRKKQAGIDFTRPAGNAADLAAATGDSKHSGMLLPEEGVYKIKINQTGKYLAIEGISKDNGARLVQWDFVNQDNHKFVLKKLGGGYYEISSLLSGRFLNAAGQLKADGTPIIQWDWANQDNVKWYLYYSNTAGNTGWVLQNKNASPIRLAGGVSNNSNGQPLVLMQPKRTDAGSTETVQTFSFEKIAETPLQRSGDRPLNQSSQGNIRRALNN